MQSSTRPQPEWVQLWRTFSEERDQPARMFFEWAHPHGEDAFRDARVLDAGCGGGQHATFVSRMAREVVAVDRSTTDLVARGLGALPNVRVRRADIATVTSEELGGTFDVVYSIGVIHHTDDPDRTFANLVRLVRPGGLLIVWVYSHEGNRLARYVVEPARKTLLRHAPERALEGLAWCLAAPALAAARSVYQLPVGRALPLTDYMRYQATLSWRRVTANVLDKLVAPRTEFIDRARIERWQRHPDLEPVHLSPFLGVSWRLSGRRRA